MNTLSTTISVGKASNGWREHLEKHIHQHKYTFNCHFCGESFKWMEHLEKHIHQQHKCKNLSDIALVTQYCKQDKGGDKPGTKSVSDIFHNVYAVPVFMTIILLY